MDRPTLEVKVDGDTSELLFDTRLKCERPRMSFKWKCEHGIAAAALLWAMTRAIEDREKELQGDAYADGWRDGHVSESRRVGVPSFHF